MRRKEREVTDPNELTKIIESCKVIRVALQDHEGLYIVPLNYGFAFIEGILTFYFHSAKVGRKLSAIKKDNRVAFELDGEHRLIEADKACGYSFAFDSIIGQGRADVVEDPEEKKTGLSLLMKHQTGNDFIFTDQEAAKVTVWKITATSYSGKRQA